MKLQLKQISPIHAALVALDGNRENGELKPFTFSSKVTWNKTKNITIMERAKAELDKTWLAKQLQASGGKDKTIPGDKAQVLNLDWSEHLETEEEINGLLAFSIEDLDVYDKKENPHGNKIPSSILSSLTPLITFPPETKV